MPPVKNNAEICHQEATPCPWLNRPNRLLSWWEMEKFSAEQFYGIGIIIERVRARYSHKRQGFQIGGYIYDLSEGDLNQISADFEVVSQRCSKLSLTISAKAASYIKDSAVVQAPPLNNLWIVKEIDSFQRNLIFEMEGHLFFHVAASKQRYYEEPFRDWGKVVERFKAAAQDIEEGSRCFACKRYAATVYHMMLVAELGVIEVGELVGVNDAKPGWSATIKEMRRVVERAKYDELTPVEREHRVLLRDLLPFIEGIELGLRNKWTHIANKIVLTSSEFSSERAEEIMLSTRGFMTTLAERLPLRQRSE